MAALENQHDAGNFEVVIVDDASTDGTWDELHRLAADASFPMRVERLDTNAGPAAARNVGWRATDAPLVAFTDDDCAPQRRWLQTLVEELSRHDIVQGRTVPNPEQQDRERPFARTINVPQERGFYETCNIAYHRRWLELVGGFDEGFRPPVTLSDWRTTLPRTRRSGPPHGEDVDLAWRMKELGARSTFSPDAVVYHEVWPPSYAAFLRDKFRKDGLVRALSKHPAFRSQRGVFQNGSHPAAVIAVGAISVFLTKPRPETGLLVAATTLLYKEHCQRHQRRPRRRRQWAMLLPLYLVADLLEITVLARASIRYRTLVL